LLALTAKFLLKQVPSCRAVKASASTRVAKEGKSVEQTRSEVFMLEKKALWGEFAEYTFLSLGTNHD